jgi:hypothetical protein
MSDIKNSFGSSPDGSRTSNSSPKSQNVYENNPKISLDIN